MGRRKFSAEDHNAANHNEWFVGDPNRPRVLPQRQSADFGPPMNSQGNLIKGLLQGQFYNLRENGYSTIHENGKEPGLDVDGSVFEPGVPADMTVRQERAFFKFAAHDKATSRTIISNILSNKYGAGQLSASASIGPNYINKNKTLASRTPLRNTSTTNGSSMSKRGRATPDELIAEGSAVLDARSRGRVQTWLRGASEEEREKFRRVIGSLSRTAAQVRKLHPLPQRRPKVDFPRRRPKVDRPLARALYIAARAARLRGGRARRKKTGAG
ncbi:hypothetical protein T484DRAFT_1903041 [Baffinella frigidus]|nr:hypothetical protein T484DRAFT_1903041 [Cryptophyta sp. CCMP2293]